MYSTFTVYNDQEMTQSLTKDKPTALRGDTKLQQEAKNILYLSKVTTQLEGMPRTI